MADTGAESLISTELLNMVLALASTDDKLQQAWEAYLKDDLKAFNSLVLASDFYQNFNSTARTRRTAEINQPGVYSQDLDAFKLRSKKRLATAGIAWSDQVDSIVEQSYRMGYNDDQVDNLIRQTGAMAKIGGTTGGDVFNLQTYANSFGVGSLLNKDYWDSVSERLFAGEITQDDIQKEIRATAASAYPAYAAQLQNGVSLDAISSAYKSSISSILEIDPDAVDYNNPHLKAALQSPTPMPLWQFEKNLKSTKEWEYTNNARDTIDTLSLKVLRDWGLA